MTRLISTVAALVFAMSTLAAAAPSQGAMGRAAEKAGAKAEKAGKSKSARGERRARGARDDRGIRDQRRYYRYDAKAAKRSLKADEKELKWYRSNLRAAERSGDWRRAARYRSAIARLEREISVERATIRDRDRNSRNQGTRLWPWWRS